VNTLASLQMLLLAGFGFVLIAGMGCSLVVRPVLHWTAQWDPGLRHRVLLLLAAAPWILALSAILSVMLPSLLGVYWPSHDHCHWHGGHAHLCFVHPAQGRGGPLGWAAIAAVVGWWMHRLARSVLALGRAHRVLGQLSAHADYDGERGAWVVPSAATFCLVAGLSRPRLLVSEGLLAASSDDDLSIVLHHERAHAQRRDNLMRLFARAASVLLLPSERRRLLAALELAAERACDEVAARRVGDRIRVAETLLTMEARLHAEARLGCSAVVANFGASSVPQRVEGMLGPPRTAGSCARLAAVLAAAVLSILAMHDGLHHVTESLIHPLGG
jgi:Zn-dependent protease with chaperone function